MVPPLPQVTLRGRDDLIAALLDGWGGVHVIHGLGGCGKTALAAEIAARAGRDAAVWWLVAQKPDLLHSGLRSLARQLGMTVTDAVGHPADPATWRRAPRIVSGIAVSGRAGLGGMTTR